MPEDLENRLNAQIVADPKTDTISGTFEVEGAKVTGIEPHDPEEPAMTKEAIDASVDKVVPGNKWEFDADVAACFNNMLERSIPGYFDMRRLSYDLGKRFIQPYASTVIDLGASRGEALRPFIEEGKALNYIGLEVSEPMRREFKKEFGAYENVSVMDYDLRTIDSGDFSHHKVDLVLSILTLLFTPIQYRSKIIKNVYDMLQPGGAFILVEKVLGSCSEIDDMLVDAYYEMKSANGYSPDDIQRKKASLEGVQVPVTRDANVAMLKAEGFSKVDGFFRNLNFAGWIAVK